MWHGRCPVGNSSAASFLAPVHPKLLARPQAIAEDRRTFLIAALPVRDAVADSDPAMCIGHRIGNLAGIAGINQLLDWKRTRHAEDSGSLLAGQLR